MAEGEGVLVTVLVMVAEAEDVTVGERVGVVGTVAEGDGVEVGDSRGVVVGVRVGGVSV